MPVFVNSSRSDWQTPEEGFNRVIASSELISVVFCRFKPGYTIEPEFHPEERLNYMIER